MLSAKTNKRLTIVEPTRRGPQECKPKNNKSRKEGLTPELEYFIKN